MHGTFLFEKVCARTWATASCWRKPMSPSFSSRLPLHCSTSNYEKGKWEIVTIARVFVRYPSIQIPVLTRISLFWAIKSTGPLQRVDRRLQLIDECAVPTSKGLDHRGLGSGKFLPPCPHPVGSVYAHSECRVAELQVKGDRWPRSKRLISQ